MAAVAADRMARLRLEVEHVARLPSCSIAALGWAMGMKLGDSVLKQSRDAALQQAREAALRQSRPAPVRLGIAKKPVRKMQKAAKNSATPQVAATPKTMLEGFACALGGPPSRSQSGLVAPSLSPATSPTLSPMQLASLLSTPEIDGIMSGGLPPPLLGLPPAEAASGPKVGGSWLTAMPPSGLPFQGVIAAPGPL